MARKPGSGKRSAKAKPARRATSDDFKVVLDKPDASPLDFINRRMAEDEGQDGDG